METGTKHHRIAAQRQELENREIIDGWESRFLDLLNVQSNCETTALLLRIYRCLTHTSASRKHSVVESESKSDW